MTVQVNGKPTELPPGATLEALMVELHLKEKRVAVEINRQLVVRKEWPARVLQESDRIEVVTFVGGG